MGETLFSSTWTSPMFADITGVMKAKLQKYVYDIPLVFTCACALNPCYNVIGVESLIESLDSLLSCGEYVDPVTKVSNESWCFNMKNKFNNNFKEMFDIYNEKYGGHVQHPNYVNPSNMASSSSTINIFNHLRQENIKRQRGSAPTSEFYRYTTTDFLSNMSADEFEVFDILAWWRGKEQQFPILAAMARDLLTVQASTVASESAFSISGRVISRYRTNLTAQSVEMCICLKDHLDAAERIQHKTSLEDVAPYNIERRILSEEVDMGMSSPYTEEDEDLEADLNHPIGDYEEFP